MTAARRARRLLAMVVIAGVLLGVPRAAWAHNALIGTTPEDASSVSRPPAAVVLTFNEPAIKTGTKVLVTGPGGDATSGEPRLVDNTVEQALGPNLPAGDYTVQWRVTSADGHPINGTFGFRVLTGAPPQPTTSPTPTVGPAEPGPSTPPTAGSGPSRWLWLLAVIPVVLAVALGWRFSRR